MAIVNFRINRIEGTRKEKRVTNVTARANSTIVSVNKEKDKNIGEHLLVNFKYEVAYEPDIGNITLEGSLWFLSPKLEDVVKDKKDSLELKKDAVMEITNAVVRDALLESLDIARKLQLPPPMQLPKVEVKTERMNFKKAS